MPEQIRCPECDATLRVPDSLLGKNVKCPKCQTTFAAEVEEPSEHIVREPPRSVTRRPSLRSEEPEDEEELPPDEEEEEDEDRPRRRRRRRRRRSGAAEGMVAGPAIAMLVVAILDIVIHLADMLLRIVLGAGVLAAGAGKGAGSPGQSAQFLAGTGVNIASNLVAIGFATVILMGAVKMKNLSNYGLAMTACILSILPCHCCCILGLPFGIWGLVVLNNPEVKDAFS